MNKSILSVLGLVMAVIVSAQDLSAERFPAEYDGTMMPYDFSRVDTVVPWGKEMKPVFVNYIARHGARYLSSEKKVGELRSVLAAQKRGNNLSSSGEKMLALIDEITEKTADNWGALSEVGINEEQRLGRELYQVAPELLSRGRVKAISTYVPRVVMTMYEVCHELARCSSNLGIAADEGHQYDSLLRFFTTVGEYEEYLKAGSWKPLYDSFAAKMVPLSPAQRMFRDASGLGDKELRKITLQAYGILQSLNASGMSGNPADWFTEEEWRLCWETDNLEHYYERSVSPVSNLPALCAMALRNDIVAKTGAHFNDPAQHDIVARLYFGHAETIMPLFAAMHLPGCYAPDCAPEEVAQKWKDYEVSPLGANLIVVILQSPENGYWAAMRLNGRWLEIDGEKVIPYPSLLTLWGINQPLLPLAR